MPAPGNITAVELVEVKCGSCGLPWYHRTLDDGREVWVPPTVFTCDHNPANVGAVFRTVIATAEPHLEIVR